MNTHTLLTHARIVEDLIDRIRELEAKLAAAQAEPTADQFIATFRCEGNGIVGTTDAKIHSVSRHDDGRIEVVIDHWPEQRESGRQR